MDLLGQLTKQQAEWYNKIKEGCYTPEEKKACDLCLSYFVDYKKSDYHNQIPPEKVQLALKCAYFLAEKSQFTVNMKGECVRGISFSVNKLLKDFKLDDTMCMLKQYQKCVRIEDKDTSSYLMNVIKELSFLYTLHMKFNKTIEKLDMKENDSSEMSNSTYLNLFKSYAWLLFIETKNKVLKKSLQLVENTYMIGYILCWMVTLAWDYLRSETILRVLRQRRISESDGKGVNKIIKQKIMEIFCLRDVDEFKKFGKLFDQFFYNNMDNMVAKMKSEKDLLSPAHIQDNYRKLDRIYMKSIDPHELDQRIFVKERTNNFTPTKFTPFARQGYLNKLQKPTSRLSGNIGNNSSKEQNFTSHRILNYELIQKQIDGKNIPTHEIKLPKNIMQSPSMVKAPLIFATPMTAAMEMVNFLKQKIKKKSNPNSTITKNFDHKAFEYINHIFMNEGAEFDEKTTARKKEQIYFLFRIISEELSNESSFEKDKKNQMFKACLALSAQIVFFVYNEQFQFGQIQELLKIKPFQMWIVLSFFMKSDKAIPTPLRLHILDLEVDLISYKLWKRPDMVQALACSANAVYSQYSEQDAFQLDKLFKRVLHQIAFQITRLSPSLGIDDGTSEGIFETMKLILTSHSDLLGMRHIDQLIMCSTYVMGRVKNLGLKFSEIQMVFKQMNPNFKGIIEQMITKVYINEEMPENTIIAFYNEVFIKRAELKEFMVSFSDSSCSVAHQKNSKKNIVLMSPLKAIIPKQISFKGQGNNFNLGKNKGNITPQTQLLYAYNESPILKYEVNSFRGPLKSKKTLNFEEQEQKSKQASEQINTRVNAGIYTQKPSTPHSQPNQNIATNDFITKKFVRNKCMQQKENVNYAVTPSNSHRSLFDTTDKKETVMHGLQKNDETWHKGKTSQMGQYK